MVPCYVISGVRDRFSDSLVRIPYPGQVAAYHTPWTEEAISSIWSQRRVVSKYSDNMDRKLQYSPQQTMIVLNANQNDTQVGGVDMPGMMIDETRIDPGCMI